jgi:hypothetical protein
MLWLATHEFALLSVLIFKPNIAKRRLFLGFHKPSEATTIVTRRRKGEGLCLP